MDSQKSVATDGRGANDFMTKGLLRVLCVEDNLDDADLLKAHLERKDFDVHLHRVETEGEFVESLSSSLWDVILADFSLPQFSAARALEILRGAGNDLPFIVVSGTIGEERAIQMMKAGANDFVLKGDYKRLIPAINRELSEADNRRARREAERALARSEVSFRQLADSMPLLVWTLDKNGSMLFANARWFSYSGLSESEMFRRGWTAIFASPQTPSAIAALDESLRAGVEFSAEHLLKNKDGEARWFLTRMTPTLDSRHQVERWYATSTDIHEQKLAAEELRTAKIAAEQANEAKSQFLANMSHEIRTPLGAILGFADLMADPNQSLGDRLDCVATIRRNGQLLSKVINEILDISKVESDRFEIERVDFNPRELIADVSTLLGLSAQEKGLKLTVVCDESVPLIITSDPTRLRQILLNIVGNAIKFTEKGEISLSASAQNQGPRKTELSIAVQDTGMGLSPEQQARLFQAFVQGDASMTRKHGGTGLGLALSRKLAQALGGNVELVDSEVGKGSRFVCRLLADCPTTTDNAVSVDEIHGPRSVNKEPRVLEGKRLLLIEDAPDNRVLISRYLSRAGANVDTEENGLSGSDRAMKESYDVILMDIQMPVMDGFTAIKRLRDSGYSKPVVALTAHAMTGYRELCLKNGFTEHLSKPIHRSALIELISKF